MNERTEKKYEFQEAPSEKGWTSFLIRVRQEVVEKAHDLIKAKPAEEAIILAEVDMLDGVLQEIGEAAPEGRKQLIENSWQEGKIPEDIYKKLTGRMEAETELEKLAEEAGLGAKEKITGPEATKAAAEAVEEAVQKNPFWSKLREKISGAGTKSKEIYEAVSRTLQEKKVFGVSLRDHLINIGTGAAVRTTTRWGLGFLTGGAGYFLAAGAGALSGGILEVRKAYKKEKNAIGLSEEEFAQKLKEIKEKAGKDLKKRIDIYSEIAKNREDGNWSEEKKKLRVEIEKSLIKRAVIRGAGKGALVGALGGAVGAALSDAAAHIFPKVMGWAGSFFAPEKAVKAAELTKGAKDLAAEAIKREAEDAAAKTYEKSIAEGLDALRNNDFSAAAMKGEGQTQVARRIIRDFIAQNKALGAELDLNKAQLIYAEDVLQKNFARGVVQPTHEFSLKGEKITEAIQQAQNLSVEKLQNIQENFVPKISEETWGKMTDYDSVVINSEAIDAIKAKAEQKATEAAGEALEEAVQMAAGAQKIPAEAVKAKDDWFKASWLNWGLIGTGTAGITALGYKLGHKYGERSEPVKLSKRINLLPKSGGPEKGAAEKETGELSGGPAPEPPEMGPTEGTETPETPEIGPPKETKTRTFREVIEFEDMTTDKIRQKFDVNILIRSSMSLSEDQAYEGSKKLREILLADKTLVEKLHDVSIRVDGKDGEPEKVKSRMSGNHIRVTVDYSKSPEDMRRYLQEAAKKAKKL